MGINSLQKVWYFAEGTARNNPIDVEFGEWLCLQNPSDSQGANITITYRLSTSRNIDRQYRIASRLTIEVAKDVGPDKDVSAKVVLDQPIAAARPVYFNYHQYAVDGSAVVGASSPANAWYFAEGATPPGFQEWITVQNPNDVKADCEITYMTGSCRVAIARQVVPPRTRATVNALNRIVDNENVSAKV
jgi:hypothetical protein